MSAIFSRRNLLVGAGLAAIGVSAAYAWHPGARDFIDNAIDRRTHRVGIVELGSGGPKWSILTFSPRELIGGVGEDRYDGVQRASRYKRQVEDSDNGDAQIDARDPALIEQVVERVRAAENELARKGVQAGRRVTVASSSITALPHLADLRAAFERAGVHIEFVNAAQEAEYAFRWLVARNDRDRATFIDIGSGNIKGGWMNSETDEFRPFEIPDGATTLFRAAEALPTTTPMPERMEAVVEERVVPHLKRLAQEGIVSDRMYLSGGTAWALRCITHPEVSQDAEWVRLSSGNIDRYHRIVVDDPSFETLIAPTPMNSPLRDRVAAIHDAISPPGRILAGGQVLAAMSREFRFDQTPHLFFANEGQFAWSTMYLLARLQLEPRL